MDDIGDLQRYSLELDDAGQAYMELDPDGRYVLFKDVAARPVEVGPERLRAALERISDLRWPLGLSVAVAIADDALAVLSSPEPRKP